MSKNTTSNSPIFFEEEQGGQVVVPLKQPQQQNAEFIVLQNVIQAKREMLLEKQRHIAQIKEQNHFLEQVKSDYEKYNSYIVSDKIRQIEAMKMLAEYLETLTAQGTLSAENMKDALHEQERIKRELESIRTNLDNLAELIPNTSSVDSDDLYDVPA